MVKLLRITCVLAAALLWAGLYAVPAIALEESAIALEFNPETDFSSRYMFQLQMTGAHVSPGRKDGMVVGEFMIGTVFKDTVVESMFGLNRHKITFYEYNVRSMQSPFGRDREDPRFGGTPWPALPGGDEGGGGEGGGGGDGGGGGEGGGGGGGRRNAPAPPGGGGFLQDLGLPGTGSPLQEGGGGSRGEGGGGGVAGDVGGSAINLDTILVTDLEYITNKRGELLDIGGLDTLRKVSRNRLISDEEDERTYIDINISHIFEWTHLLYLPEDPVYKEDIWFHTTPLHIPGLPDDEPVMTRFMYKLIDFRTVGNRKVAVIDLSGVAEWNLEWDDRTEDELTEFKSWGNMGISARYWFDYEKKEIFGIARPGFTDWQYRRSYQAFDFYWPYDGLFAMRYPGIVINWEFFYNTQVTDISDKPRMATEEPKVNRRYIVLNLFCQLEAE